MEAAPGSPETTVAHAANGAFRGDDLGQLQIARSVAADIKANAGRIKT